MSEGFSFLGVRLNSRSVLASGVLGVTLSSLRRVFREGAGVVTTKSIGPDKRKGHVGPVVHDWGHGLINAVGLSNPGVEGFLAEWAGEIVDFPLILSIFGKTEQDFPLVAGRVDALGHAFLELNISCPNVLDEFGAPFSFSPELTYRITRSVKDRTKKPLIVKLSPNTPLVKKVAKAAEEGGADALCVMNTVGPGMAIDVSTASPVLGNRAGGLSGSAVLPLTVRHVYDLYGAVRVPIIGMGGIASASAAIQVMMAGASLYGVGSAVYEKGLSVFREIDGGVAAFLEKNGLSSAEEIIGLAHREKTRVFFRAPQEPVRTARAGPKFSFAVRPVEKILGGEQGSVRTFLLGLGEMAAAPRPPRPGQFFMVWLPRGDQKPYSVSRFDGQTVGFSLQARGRFSGELMEVKMGEPVGLLGPLGSEFTLDHEGSYLLVGGGIGLAPLLFGASELAAHGKRVTLLAGARSAASLRWIHEVLGRADGGKEIDIFCCTDDGSYGVAGMITHHLQRVIDDAKPGFALLCGPEPFMRAAIDLFRNNGIPGEAAIERMMKCGVGICGSCSLDETGDRVCVEGPVFSFDSLAGQKEFGRYERDESGTKRYFE
jgi:dihydroorotate dehydrogenase (NAD+) catalytic subunit